MLQLIGFPHEKIFTNKPLPSLLAEVSGGEKGERPLQVPDEFFVHVRRLDQPVFSKLVFVKQE